MKKSKSLVAIFLISILIISVGFMIQKQKNSFSKITISQQSNVNKETNTPTAAFFYRYFFSLSDDFITQPMTFSSYTRFSEKTTLLENNSRTEIFRYIQANPGVQFRAICSSLGLSIGVVQFHLAVLHRNGLIKWMYIGRYKRFFAAAGKFSRKEMEIIARLKLETVKNILKTLLKEKIVVHHELAIKLQISSQGLTWQINRLQNTGLIKENRKGLNVSYSLNTSNIIALTYALNLVEKISE